jgi:hypothetical protein
LIVAFTQGPLVGYLGRVLNSWWPSDQPWCQQTRLLLLLLVVVWLRVVPAARMQHKQYRSQL